MAARMRAEADEWKALPLDQDGDLTPRKVADLRAFYPDRRIETWGDIADFQYIDFLRVPGFGKHWAQRCMDMIYHQQHLYDVLSKTPRTFPDGIEEAAKQVFDDMLTKCMTVDDATGLPSLSVDDAVFILAEALLAERKRTYGRIRNKH